MKFLIYVISIFFIATPVFGHGDGYFEFSPDNSDAYKLSSGATPHEIFLPQNDFLDGFDIWLDNTGDAGTVRMELYDAGNVLRAVRTINIPAVVPQNGGTRYHVDFVSQIPVISEDAYTLKIITDMPELRFYTAPHIRYLSHNEPFISKYLNGVVRIGGEEQNFSFLFVLYEDTENTAPVISDISVEILADTSTRVTFFANESVDSKLDYGIAGNGYTEHTGYTGTYTLCITGMTPCEIEFSVGPNETYEYELTVRDEWGNEAAVTGMFDSATVATPTPEETSTPTASPEEPSPDETAPEISNARVVNLTPASAEFAWTTDEAATSELLVSLVQGDTLITVTADQDTTFELEHLLGSGDSLTPDTRYNARITSRDAAHNISEETLEFTTPKASLPESSPTPSPTPSPAPLVTEESPDGSVTVTVARDDASSPQNYRIDVFDDANNLIKQYLIEDGEPETAIADLPDGSYTVIAYEDDNGVFRKIAEPTTFTKGKKSFLEQFFIYFPYIGIGFVGIIIIAWILLKRRKPKRTITTKPI